MHSCCCASLGGAVVPYRLHAIEQEGWGDVLCEGGALRNLAFREACSHSNAGPWHPDLGAALWKNTAGPHCEFSATLLSSIQSQESINQMLAQYFSCCTAVGYCLVCLCCHSLHLGRPGAVSLVSFRGPSSKHGAPCRDMGMTSLGCPSHQTLQSWCPAPVTAA